MKTKLSQYLRARRPVIWINSSDYKEIDTLIKDVSKDIPNSAIYEYRALGSVDFETKEISDGVKDLYNMINTIYSDGMKNTVFLLIKNATLELEKPEVLAYIKKIAELKYSNSDYNFTTIIVSESGLVPKELEKFTSILEINNMNQEEIENYIKEFAKKNSVKVDEKDLGELSISLKGLTKLETDHVLNMMIESKKNISISDRQVIIREKGQIIKKSAILELIDFKEQINDIGGLEGLKEWLDNKSKIFRRLDEAKKFGVDTPKGVLLVGMPGCGKSLAAKASARLFNAPLLRLDIGRLLGKYVGESEHNMRVALKTAESISPCILWIDEIEKAFAGIDQSGGASDITKRLFGQFLTWLQEKENTVFVVATANDISSFPPEFLRKGRFDEVFFVDFPNEEERERIFEIHLEKRGKNPEDIDLLKLAKATEGYCGADIEEIVKLTLETAFIEEEEIGTEDIIASIKEIDSLSNILKDKIEQLKKGFEKFKIKSATEKISRVRKIKKNKLIKTSDKDMVFIQGGKYKLSFFEEEREVFDIWMDKYQVTQDKWKEFMETDPSRFKGPRRPVEMVSWLDTLEFCNKMSEYYGLQPVYKIENGALSKIIYSNGEEVYPNLADFRNTEGYRLPTELEWEWAARGGEVALQDETFDYKYSGSNNIEEVAWYDSSRRESSENFYGMFGSISLEKSMERGRGTHDVGSKKYNQLGLYDMSGNIWEWCYDTTSSVLYDMSGGIWECKRTISFGYIDIERAYIYDASINSRRLKGGSWCDSADVLEVSYRFDDFSKAGGNVGFRVCRTV